MKKRQPLGLLVITFSVLAGCSANPSTQVATQVANRDLEAHFSPVRYAETPIDRKASITKAEWAGVPGTSILNNAPQVRADVLRSFKENCGLNEEQLSEVRVVKHFPPTFYEVWVFNDPLSQREDGKSGISIVLKQLPNNGGVDFSFHGGCHSKKPPVFYSTR